MRAAEKPGELEGVSRRLGIVSRRSAVHTLRDGDLAKDEKAAEDVISRIAGITYGLFRPDRSSV